MSWRTEKLKNFIEFTNGLNFSKTDNGQMVKIVGVGDFKDKTILLNSADLSSIQVTGSLRDEDYLKKNDLLFVRSNGNKNLIGRCLLIKTDDQISFSGFTIRGRIKSESRVNEFFISQLFKTDIVRSQFLRVGGGTNISNLSQAILNNIEIQVPKLPEQKKIARILSTWDSAIEKLEALIEAKQTRKKALMQQLLTGKKRISTFKDKQWMKSKIGDLLIEVKRPIEWDEEKDYKLLSIKRRSGGLFLRNILNGKQILTKTMNIAKNGDFLISKMQVLHGASALTTKEFDGMYISNSYISLVSKDCEKLDIRFLNWLSKTPLMYHKAYISSYGVHIEKMTFNLRLYLKEEIELPENINEQKKIIGLLDQCDKEIKLHQKQLEALKIQKKGLMQQLLTGKKRVQPDPEDFEN